MPVDRGRYSLVLAAAVAAIAVPCCADTIPPVVFSGQVYFGGVYPDINGPGTYTIGSGSNFMTATLLYQNGEASISGSGSNTTNYDATMDPAIYVSFEVLGSISEAVPLIITGTGSASATSEKGLDATVNGGISPNWVDLGYDFSACSGPSCGGGELSSFSSSVSVNVDPGIIYQIGLGFTAGSIDAALGATWSFAANEELAIDPSFADASDFTLEFSANPPPATAPEASSMPLLLAGCLALAAVFRSRLIRLRQVYSGDSSLR